MFAYCNNNPVNFVDSTGYSLEYFLKNFADCIKNSGGALSAAGAAALADSPLPGPGDIVGIGILGAVLVTCAAAAVMATANYIAAERDEAEEKVAESTQTAIYYGADRYGGTWKLVTEQMNYSTALGWVSLVASNNVYGKNASWGLYTTNQNDAYVMAASLGGPLPIHHPGNVGEYPHYHVQGYDLFGQYKHFHVWYGSKN